MVINGGSRSGLAGYTGYLGWHLQRREVNEAVFVREMTGITAPDLTAALDELAMMGAGSRSKRPLYHANIDWRHDEQLTPAQKARAVDRLADELGFTGQPRVVVEHVKQGREHLHVVWLRIDPETGKAIPDSHNFRRHEIVARELEREFGLEPVQGVHIERDGIERPQRTPEPFEFAQAARSGITPAEARAELSGFWQGADTGQAFAAALADAGWVLARGDRRDVLVALDPAGETHAINKKVTGLVAAQVRAKLADLDPTTLPSVDEARQVIRERVLDAAQPQPAPGPELGGMEVAPPFPEATQRPSYEAVPELPPDLNARFGPSEPEPASPTPPEPEPPYVPNFVLVVDLTELDARFGPGPDVDPEAGMVIDATPEPVAPFDIAAELGPEGKIPHLDTGAEAVRRHEPAHGPERDPSANAARRAMEELARTDPLGMAARHGFHMGDQLKSPEDMRREMAARMRGFAADPQPEPSPDVATPDPAPEIGQRSRLADLVARARDRLAELATRLDAAFAMILDRQREKAPEVRPTPEISKPAEVEAPQPRPLNPLDAFADLGRQQPRKKAPEPEPDAGRSIWDDFQRGPRMKGPGGPGL